MHDAIPDDMHELWFIHFVRNLVAHAACKERHVEQFAAASVQNAKQGTKHCIFLKNWFDIQLGGAIAALDIGQARPM